MDKVVEWPLWSAEQIAEALPGLVAAVEFHLPELPSEHLEKNRAAVEVLKGDVPGAAKIRDGSRSRDLTTLGFALDVLGRRAARDGELGEALRLFQAAHELFRRANPSMHATRPMRQTLGNAVRVLLTDQVARCRRGDTDVRAVRAALAAFVRSAWGTMPTQVTLAIDEMILVELERARLAAESDPEARDRLVQDNIEAVLELAVPTRLERIRRDWEEIGERIAPAAVRRAQRAVRRPEPLSTLVPPVIWAEVRQAVERGDTEALGQALTDVRDELEGNLRLRLDAKPEHRDPVSELRIAGAPDPAFLQARELLLRRDPRALDEFADLHYRRSTNTIAKEWYAYALTLFGQGTDIHDIIELLEAAIASDRFHEHRGWTARWNLACALRRLPSRADEALDVLLPVLELDAHPAEAFELCLLWAIEQNRRDALATLCLRARHHEAHLLAALLDAETSGDGGGAAQFRDHFRRINRILRDPDRVFPDPRERLLFEELDQLTREFIETSLVATGIEWFRQRVAAGPEAGVFKNWECAATLTEEAGNLAASWRCRLHSWRVTQHRRNVEPRKKAQLLRTLLGWAQRHGFHEDGLRVLRQSGAETSFSEADSRLWAERLGAPGADAASGGPGEDAGSVGGGPEPRTVTAPQRDVPQGSRPRVADSSARRAALALMLDWENVKVSLARHLDDLPEARGQAARARLGGVELASRLLDAAWRHGLPRQRWAVADWDQDFFAGDQKAVRNARFSTDIAGRDKANASDHVLREKIHFVLREYPEIPVYVIGTGDGDFHEVVKTLHAQGKQVILWTTRRAISESYGGSLRGPDRIRIEWLEDLVFGEMTGGDAR
jgi:tetratricopeptide (TPR) repeat protein